MAFDFINDGLRRETALCQNDRCRAIVGQYHITCPGGLVAFVCYKCGTVSEFRNEPHGWRASVKMQVPAKFMRPGPATPDGSGAGEKKEPQVVVRPRLRAPGDR